MPDDEEVTDVEKLQDIMDDLRVEIEYHGSSQERRKYSLTEGDILLIYKIAKIANNKHVCPFEEAEQDTLKGVASNISRTQKVASVLIITGLVTAIGSGVWVAIRHFILEWVKTGGKLT